MPRSETGAQLPGGATIAGSARRGRARTKYQCEAVDAVAQAGRFRSIVEDVAEVTAAATAMNFSPQHPKRAVLGFADCILERLIETRPTRAALELGLRGEQRQIATGAGEGALAVLLQQRAGTWALGPLLAQDLVLLRRELCAPFRVGFFDFELFRGLCRGGTQPAECAESKQTGEGRKQNTAIDHLWSPCEARYRMVRFQVRRSVSEVTPVRLKCSHFVASSRAAALWAGPRERPLPRCGPARAASDSPDAAARRTGAATAAWLPPG